MPHAFSALLLFVNHSEPTRKSSETAPNLFAGCRSCLFFYFTLHTCAFLLVKDFLVLFRPSKMAALKAHSVLHKHIFKLTARREMIASNKAWRPSLPSSALSSIHNFLSYRMRLYSGRQKHRRTGKLKMQFTSMASQQLTV